MGLVGRGEVWWVNLDPTVGTEINKTRPALVVLRATKATLVPAPY